MTSDPYGWLTRYYYGRPYAFDRVTISTRDGVPCSLLGVCYSEYPSGPNLSMLAAAAAQVTGVGGYYGLASCRFISYGRPDAG